MIESLQNRDTAHDGQIVNLMNTLNTKDAARVESITNLTNKYNQMNDSQSVMNFDIQELIYEMDALKRNWSVLTGEEITSIIDGTASSPTEERFVPYLIDSSGEKVPECTVTDAIQFMFEGNLKAENQDRGRAIISTANNTPTGIKWEMRSVGSNDIIYSEDDNKKSFVIYADHYPGGNYYLRVYLTSNVNKEYDESNYWDSKTFGIIGAPPCLVDFKTASTKIEPCTQTPEIRIVKQWERPENVDDIWFYAKFDSPVTAVKMIFYDHVIPANGKVAATVWELNGEYGCICYVHDGKDYLRDNHIPHCDIVRVYATNKEDKTFDNSRYWDSEVITL